LNQTPALQGAKLDERLEAVDYPKHYRIAGA